MIYFRLSELSKWMFFAILVWVCAGKALPLVKEARAERAESTGHVLVEVTAGFRALAGSLNQGTLLTARDLKQLANQCTASREVRSSADDPDHRDLLEMIGLACNDWGKMIKTGVGIDAVTVIQFSEMLTRETRIRHANKVIQQHVSTPEDSVHASDFVHPMSQPGAWVVYPTVIRVLEKISSI